MDQQKKYNHWYIAIDESYIAGPFTTNGEAADYLKRNLDANETILVQYPNQQLVALHQLDDVTIIYDPDFVEADPYS